MMRVTGEAGPNGCVSMRTKVDYFLYDDNHSENIGTPLMSDTLSFPQEFVEELFVDPLEKIKGPAINKEQCERGIQTSHSKKAIETTKKRSKSRNTKICCCDNQDAPPLASTSSQSVSDSSADEPMSSESTSSICCCH